MTVTLLEWRFWYFTESRVAVKGATARARLSCFSKARTWDKVMG